MLSGVSNNNDLCCVIYSSLNTWDSVDRETKLAVYLLLFDTEVQFESLEVHVTWRCGHLFIQSVQLTVVTGD